MDNLLGAWKSKTVWLGLGLAVFGYLQAQDHLIKEFLDPQTAGWVNMGFGLVVIVLRFATTVPLSQK